ncbi:MAG: hypothetical protein IKS90_08085 [Clostridia bacterium]|nr:hypothetical protein [Clostridia bacterium]
MDFLELSRARFSVLEYDNSHIERKLIDKIVEEGIAATAACSNRPQMMLIIDSDEKGRKPNRVVPSKYYVPIEFLICYDKRECRIRPMGGGSFPPFY